MYKTTSVGKSKPGTAVNPVGTLLETPTSEREDKVVVGARGRATLAGGAPSEGCEYTLSAGARGTQVYTV